MSIDAVETSAPQHHRDQAGYESPGGKRIGRRRIESGHSAAIVAWPDASVQPGQQKAEAGESKEYGRTPEDGARQPARRRADGQRDQQT
jgi:hypothetical protein